MLNEKIMNQKQVTNSHSPTAIHPSEIAMNEEVTSLKEIYSKGLIVRHSIHPPEEIESPPITEHLLMCQWNISKRQINRIGDKEFDGVMNKGDFFLQPASFSAFYSWENTDESISFIIKPQFLYQIATKTECLNPDKIELTPITLIRDPQIKHIASLFFQELQNSGLGGELYSESLANVFAIHLLRNYCVFPATFKEYTGGLPPYKLRQAINYINDNLDQKIKLDDVAKLIDISQYYFCHLFKESTGIAPYQYVLKQRVEKAKELTKQSKLPLAEIAFECGFSSQSQMTQHFRRSVGVTPKVYRNRL